MECAAESSRGWGACPCRGGGGGGGPPLPLPLPLPLPGEGARPLIMGLCSGSPTLASWSESYSVMGSMTLWAAVIDAGMPRCRDAGMPGCWLAGRPPGRRSEGGGEAAPALLAVKTSPRTRMCRRGFIEAWGERGRGGGAGLGTRVRRRRKTTWARSSLTFNPPPPPRPLTFRFRSLPCFEIYQASTGW